VPVRSAVLDVGSNTIRLLVADVRDGGLTRVEGGRVRLALGEEIERHGGLSATSIGAAAKAVRKLCAVAARCGVDAVDVFLTAPGRQAANADELVVALQHVTRHAVRVLTEQEEGRLAYRGAVATCAVELPAVVTVCDVGGASTEVAVGRPGSVPSWVESVDIGSVRLTARSEHARDEARAALQSLSPPRAEAALAVGGTARAARRLAGAALGADELAEALRLAQSLDAAELARRFDVHPTRARILPAGVAILAEVQELLGIPLHVCSGGIREGALLVRRAALAA
jgi:exopolyphosphatase/guanosine-5'-triphosphate,3'-diphosphate pyrophosphatase